MKMHILIIGAAGMIGRKLTDRLIADRTLLTDSCALTLFDRVEAPLPEAHGHATSLSGDLADKAQAERLASLRPDVIFHLASIVSGEAETDFQLGWQVNMTGSWQLLEALAAQTQSGAYCPKVIFTSSIAVFGPPYPEAIDDDFLCAPQTSYGAQKAAVELLVSDYSRKGFIDGMSIRLPTICVRPGKPNLAASSFFSGIIREPLSGQQAALPVDGDVRHWHASPRSAAGFLVHAAGLDTSRLEGRRSLNMPGVSCTVDEQIDALRAIAGEDAVRLIIPKPDEAVRRIVSGWPRNFTAERATSLGFVAETEFSQIITTYLEDDFPLR